MQKPLKVWLNLFRVYLITFFLRLLNPRYSSSICCIVCFFDSHKHFKKLVALILKKWFLKLILLVLIWTIIEFSKQIIYLNFFKTFLIDVLINRWIFFSMMFFLFVNSVLFRLNTNFVFNCRNEDFWI